MNAWHAHRQRQPPPQAPPAVAAPPAGQVPGALLEIDGLCAGYGAAQVLHDVDLTVRRGEVVALMGRNGAGKSTLLKATMGLLARRSGRVRFCGQDITQWPAYLAARQGLGYVPEERRIFADLTVRENLEVARQGPRAAQDGQPMPCWTPERLFELFPALAAMGRRRAGHLSGGEQQMLCIARTLMGNPRLILLDEPAEGVAPVVVDRLADAVQQLKAQGLGVVLSEQNLPFAAALAERVVVLEQGQVRLADAMTAWLANEQARAAWLGV